MDLPVITPGPLSVTVQPDTVVTEDAKLMPPPSSYVKKAAIEHPGENYFHNLGKSPWRLLFVLCDDRHDYMNESNWSLKAHQIIGSTEMLIMAMRC